MQIRKRSATLRTIWLLPCINPSPKADDPNLQYNIIIKRSVKYAYFQRKFIRFTETYARDKGQFVLDMSPEDNSIVLSHLIN